MFDHVTIRVAGTPTEHVHLAFAAGDDATVDAFVLDPDGNHVELVNHNRR